MLYTSFKEYYPSVTIPANVQGVTPAEPRDDLLQAVIDLGMVPENVLIEYEVDGSGEFTEVPETIRQAARDWWISQL